MARPVRTRASLLGGLAIVVALGLGGCSTSIPSMISYDDVTGSIEKPGLSFASMLEPEDWRRAHAALGLALDPQGNGALVNWDNPQSGARGTFTAVGQAYPSKDAICRAFLADVSDKATARQLQGVGCREKDGDWRVTDLKPWKKA
jgi:surface antigen